MGFTFCSKHSVHIHVNVLNKVNTFHTFTKEWFQIECKDYVQNYSETIKQQRCVVFFRRYIAYTTHHFCMKTVTSQLSIPRLLVRVSATRWRGDLEVPYYLPLLSSSTNPKVSFHFQKYLLTSVP